MRYFEFQNVRIGIRAKNGKEAYTKLCNALAGIHADFSTDTFTRTDKEDEKPQPTSKLFPKVG